MEQNFEQTFTVTSPKADVEMRIREYFGSSLKRLEICMLGRAPEITTLDYENFKPVRQVRRDIEDMFPNVEIESINREYSDDKYLMIFDEFMNRRIEVYVPEQDGTLKKTSLFWLFEDELRHRTFKD